MIKKRPLLFMFLLLAALQAALLVLFPPFIEPDSGTYIQAATNWLSTGTYVSDFRPPGYPAFLALIYSVFGESNFAVIVVQHLLGLLAWFLVVNMLATDRQKLIFTALFTCDLLYSSYQHAILADSLLSVELCVSAALLKRYMDTRRPALLAAFAIVIAAGIYTKPVLKPFPLLAALMFLFDPGPLTARLRRAALVLLLPLLLTGLWSLRNYVNTGYFAMVPMESNYYIGRVINHVEFPADSVAGPYLLAERGPGPVARDMKGPVTFAAMEKIKAAGIPQATMDREFRQGHRLAVTRHPFIYLKESGAELVRFFFSAHNLYARSLFSESMPVSVPQGLRDGKAGPLLLKLAVSMHPFYWLLLALLLYQASRALASPPELTRIYMYATIAYIALVSSFINEGLARYRGAVHPFMIFFSAVALDSLLSGARRPGKR